MNRRGWAWFQAGGALVLLLAAPGAIVGLMDGMRGPYEVRAETKPVVVWNEAAVAADRAGASVVATVDPPSTP